MIQHADTANRLGITLGDLDELFAGRATWGVAKRLRLTTGDIESFINGGFVAADVGTRLALSPPAAVDELARKLGREGRIGLMLGLLFG